MNGLLWIHIAGGVLALVAGSVAVAVRKGGRVHVAAGRGFVVSMFVLGVTASILGPFASPPQSSVGGIMVCYFVATGWLAAHRSGRPGAFEKIACALVLAMAAAILADGVERALAPPGRFPGPPEPGAVLALGVICLVAGLLDLRFILRGQLSAAQRVSRHLWRMCLAFFVATGSFFLGQQDVMPMAVRGSPILVVLAFAPLALMLVALARVRFSSYPRAKAAADRTASTPDVPGDQA